MDSDLAAIQMFYLKVFYMSQYVPLYSWLHVNLIHTTSQSSHEENKEYLVTFYWM